MSYTYEIELNQATGYGGTKWVAELHYYEGNNKDLLEKTRLGVYTADGKEEARRYAICAMNEHKNIPKDDPVFGKLCNKKYVVQTFYNCNVQSFGPVIGKAEAEKLLDRLERQKRAKGRSGSAQIIELESPDIPKMCI